MLIDIGNEQCTLQVRNKHACMHGRSKPIVICLAFRIQDEQKVYMNYSLHLTARKGLKHILKGIKKM